MYEIEPKMPKNKNALSSIRLTKLIHASKKREERNNVVDLNVYLLFYNYYYQVQYRDYMRGILLIIQDNI